MSEYSAKYTYNVTETLRKLKTTVNKCGRVMVSAFISLLILVSCEKADVPETTRSKELTSCLKAIDDSLHVNSPHVSQMIQNGMKHATDTLEYCDFYLRGLYYDIVFNIPDTTKKNWQKMSAFLEKKPKTPRVRGLLGGLYNVEGSFYHKFHHQPQKVIQLYRKAYDMLYYSDTKHALPDVCANLGDAYIAINDMPHAAQWYRRALFLADSLQLPKENNVTLYMGLGRIYLNLGDLNAADECYRQTEKNFSSIPIGMKFYFLNNYGNYYYYKKDYKQALAMFKRYERLIIDHGLDESYDMYLCKLNMADVYLNLGNTGEASRLLKETEPFFERINDRTALYYINTIKIGVAINSGNPAVISNILKNEKPIAGIDFNLTNIRQKYLRKYYEERGDYKSAYKYLMADKRHNDSLKHNMSNMRASEIMLRYTHDTLQLHHMLALREKEVTVSKANTTIILAALAMMLLVTSMLTLVIYERKRKLQMRMQMMRFKLTGLRNRISPHFIFNVLSSHIPAEDDKNELVSLAKLLRAGIGMSDKDYVTLEEELNFVKYYIDTEPSCQGKDFKLNITVPQDSDMLNKIMIPAMFIQILSENAIKHGLSGKTGEKILDIAVEMTENTCRVSVTDNGAGFDIRQRKNTSTGTGLKVIRNTIALINSQSKRKISFRIMNRHDADGTVTGCNATIEIPLGIWNQEFLTT